MAGITLADARTKTLQLLDDPNGTRWSTAQVDDALGDCVSACLTRYAKEGGDRFDEYTSVTTSATDGTVSIASVNPLWVKGVALVVSDSRFRLPPKEPMRSGYADLAARSLSVFFIREYGIPSNSAHPLIGNGAVAANSWRAFDRWVCYEAALQLAPKDMEAQRLALLVNQGEKTKADAFVRPVTPGGYSMPRQEWLPVYDDLRWQFVQGSTIVLTRRGWWW